VVGTHRDAPASAGPCIFPGSSTHLLRRCPDLCVTVPTDVTSLPTSPTHPQKHRVAFLQRSRALAVGCGGSPIRLAGDSTLRSAAGGRVLAPRRIRETHGMSDPRAMTPASPQNPQLWSLGCSEE
jgi:hypothetical protein